MNAQQSITLSDMYPSWSTLFTRYPNPGEDNTPGGAFSFLAWDYGNATLNAEAARFAPVIGGDIQMLMENIPKELIGYYEQTYPDTFNAQGIISYEAGSHLSAIKKVKEKTLITLHPYPGIDEDKYTVHPHLQCNLNDKTNMKLLTNKIPAHSVLKLDDIKKIDHNFPIVLKAHSWASGDGVRIVHDTTELWGSLAYFASANETELMVEEFINATNNYGVQWVIKATGELELLWISEQYTSPEGEYMWGLITKNQSIPDDIKELFFEVGDNAKKLGFVGIFGLDIMRDSDGNIYLIDPNFRLTGATTSLFLQNQIFTETWSTLLQFWSFTSGLESVKDVLDMASNSNKAIYILSAVRDMVSGIIKGHAITHGNEKSEIQSKIAQLSLSWIHM